VTAHSDYGVAVWASPEWRERAVAWLDAQLAAAGIERTGDVEQPHLRPWATALRVPTTDGVVWMKAAGPGTAFEVALYEFLGQVAPAYVLRAIAIDVDRGWIVIEDGGTPLREQFQGDELVEAMTSVLAQYAQLQRDLAPHAEDLVALGVADMRAEALPARFEEALAVVGAYVEQRGEPDEAERYARLRRLGPTVAEWCDELVAAPGGASLDHNDLHAQNVFLTEPGGRARFYDWGDSVVAHPFTSMLVALDFMQHDVLEVGPQDARVLRLRDAYLEAFTDLAPHAELVKTLELARRLALIARTLIWDRAVKTLATEGVADEWASAPFETLSSLLDVR
jgi:Phosphotransferase enzyme family